MNTHLVLQILMYGFHIFAVFYILKFFSRFMKLYDLVLVDAIGPDDSKLRLQFLQKSYRDLKVLAILLFTQTVVIFCYFFFVH